MPEPRALRKFRFVPPIQNVEYNEWRFRKETHTEMLVTNLKSGVEIWIPYRLLGEVSVGEDGETTVGLIEELEYRNGTASPRGPALLEMPRAIVDHTAESVMRRPGEKRWPCRWLAFAACVCVLALLVAFALRYARSPKTPLRSTALFAIVELHS